MNVKQIVEHIIDHHARTDSGWLTDILLQTLQELYGMDELTALEREPEIKERVKDAFNLYVAYCRERQVPPKIRLLNDVLIGKQRPESMSDLEEPIRKMEPFEFQRLCCIYIRDLMGYSIETVNRLDGGADIIARRDVSIVGQARRHLERIVGRTELYQWVIQVKERFSGAAFVFLTATQYSRQARSYARQEYVKLVDGEQIAGFLSELGVLPNNISAWLVHECQKCTTSKCDLKPK